ncbi:Biotin sulfoxide reductase [Bienertia sinuspersici]
MASNKITFANMQNPLFMQPSDNSSSIQVEKLQVASDYPLWRRSMKINLSSKRKMELMIGELVKDNTDEVKAELWKICNNMVIA